MSWPHNRESWPGRFEPIPGVWAELVRVVALDPSLADDFREMLGHPGVESITDMNEGVYNYYRDSHGLNVHKSYGYLVNPHVARVIADWWKAT